MMNTLLRITVFFTVMLSMFLAAGCATVDYCDMTQPARCDWEAKLEDQLNAGLDAIDSAARVDVVINCPGEPGNCPGPAVQRDAEAGDFKIIRSVINGR